MFGLEPIFEFFTYLARIIGHAVNDFVQLFKYLGDALSHVPGLLVWLPASIGTLVSVMFGVVVLYKVLGREG